MFAKGDGLRKEGAGCRRTRHQQQLSSANRALAQITKIVADNAGAATGQIAGEHLDSGFDQTMCKRPPARS